MIAFEGETDTMAAWQALPDELRDRVGVFGISGVGSWDALVRNGWVERLTGAAKRVFFPLDRDDPYSQAEAAVAAAWRKIQRDLGRRARRVMWPQGINDGAEFFLAYDWAAFQTLLKQAATPKRHYPRLDLTKPTPETDWLIEHLLVSHEAHGLIGDGGVGKSFITMAMALAVADPECDSFLGLRIRKHGPVLYVDEESSEDLVRQRLHALGLNERHLANLEYIWYAGVDLLNEPEKLHEEALDIEPALVIVDSLSRVALGADENSNPDMTRLIRAGIIPIARESGASVVVVHHTGKDGVTARGATAIRNTADQVLSVVKATVNGKETGRLNIFPSKPRRLGAHLQAEIVGNIEEDGWVRVQGITEEAAF